MPVAHDAPGSTSDSSAWSVALSAYVYMIPDEPNYVQPTITADHGRLHLEARYDYEGIHTGSTWVGCNFSLGQRLQLDLTMMVGGVFGETQGIATGYEASLTWWKLELYDEGELLIDLGDASNTFFYNWAQLTLWPTSWFELGGVVQRTQAQVNHDVQTGVLVGISFDRVTLEAMTFNLTDEPTFVLAAEIAP